MTLPSITFFFPYHEVSGVPVLFLRVAEHLADRMGLEVNIVDFEDGYMSRMLSPGSKVRCIPFREGATIDVSPNTLLVLQSIFPFSLRPELHIQPATRILFWTLHPLNLVQTIIPSPFFRQLQLRSQVFQRLGTELLFPGLRARLARMVETMHYRRGILFMDASTLATTVRYLGLDIPEPHMLPVPSMDATINVRLARSRHASVPLQVGWVGRLADFKIHILVYTIQKLKTHAQASKTAITMHIVGEGPEAAALEPFLQPAEYFNLVLHGSMPHTQLDAFLVENLDVLAAMGTSALEGARLGIPTILMDISYGAVPEGYSFRWLHHAQGYTLGDVIRPDLLVPGNSSLESILAAVQVSFPSISEAAYDYYCSNHAISVVAERFCTYAQTNDFHYEDFHPSLFRKSLVRRIFEQVRP